MPQHFVLASTSPHPPSPPGICKSTGQPCRPQFEELPRDDDIVTYVPPVRYRLKACLCRPADDDGKDTCPAESQFKYTSVISPVANACDIAADVSPTASQFRAYCGAALGVKDEVTPLSVTLAQCEPTYCDTSAPATNAGDRKICGYRVTHLLCCPALGPEEDIATPRVDPSVAVLRDTNDRLRQLAQVDVRGVELLPEPTCACCGPTTTDNGQPIVEMNARMGAQLRGLAAIATTELEQDTPLGGQTFDSPDQEPKFTPTYYGDDVDKSRERRAEGNNDANWKVVALGIGSALDVQGGSFESGKLRTSAATERALRDASSLFDTVYEPKNSTGRHGICFMGSERCTPQRSRQNQPSADDGVTLTAQYQMFARVGEEGDSIPLPNGLAAASVPFRARAAPIMFQEDMYLPSALLADLSQAEATTTCKEVPVTLSLRQTNLKYGPAGRDTGREFTVLARTIGCRQELCTEAGKCSDPDADEPLAERTTVSGLQNDADGRPQPVQRTDYCASDDVVVEYACADNRVVAKKTSCPEGGVCDAGACKTCIDPDGASATVASYAYDVRDGKRLRDTCVKEGDSLVLEAVCEGAFLRQVERECPKGTRCFSGACREAPPPDKAPTGDSSDERDSGVDSPRRRRRDASSGGPTAFAEGFPTGICGCGSVFPDDAKGSYFSLDNGGTVLSEADLEGLTREEIGRLYFHPVANYFGRIGFTAFGISMENGTETSITPAPLGITVNSDNDAPTLSLSSSSEVTASVFDVVALPAVTMQDVDALDGTVQLRVYSRNFTHRLYLWPVPAGVRLVEQVADPRAQDPAGPEAQFAANGQHDLYIQATLVNGSLTLDGLWLEALATSPDDEVIFEMSDLFFSALDRGAVGLAQASVELAVGPPFPAPSGLALLPQPARPSAGLIGTAAVHFTSLTAAVDMPLIGPFTPLFAVAPGANPGQTFALSVNSSTVSFSPPLPASGTVAELNAALQQANVTWAAGNYTTPDAACAFPLTFVLDGTAVTSLLLVPTPEALLAAGLPASADILVCGGDGIGEAEMRQPPQNVSLTIGPSAPACDEDSALNVTLSASAANTSANNDISYIQVLVWLADGSVTRQAAGPLSSNVTEFAPAPPAALLPAGAPSVVQLAGPPDEVIAALSNLTLRPSPDFNGETTLYVDIIAFDDEMPSVGALGLHDPELHGAAGVLRFAFSVAVAPKPDPIRLLTPGYLFLRELEATTLWSIYVMDADTADAGGDYTVEVSTTLGAISLLPSLQASLAVTLHGGAASMPAPGFTLVGAYADIAAAMGGITFHATACDFAPGACESRYSTLDVRATDPAGDVDEHSIIVDITCIAEVPLLETPDVSGDEDTAIPLSIFAAPRDPAERVFIYFENFPPGVTFNNGQANGRRWRLEVDDLTGLTVQSVPNSHDDFTFNVTAIALEISNGDTASNTTVQRVTLNAVNDKPDVAAPGTQYALEDTVSRLGVPAVISDIADLPGGLGGDYEVLVTVDHGVLRYGLRFGNETMPPSCVGDMNLTACAGYNTASISLRGPMEAVNAALGTLFYLGDANYEGNDQLDFVVNDHGTEGLGGAMLASDSSLLIVKPVNDAPTISMPSTPQSGCTPDVENRTCLPVIDGFRPREDCFTWLYNALNLADIDEKGDRFTIFINTHFGSWTLNPFADYTNIEFERGDGVNDRAMMFHGPLADIQAAVSLMAYTGVENFHGWDTLAITLKDSPVDDTAAEVTEAAYTFEVRPVNDAPLLSVAADHAIVQPGGTTTFSLNVIDDQYLNTSLSMPTALMNSQTRVRVYMGAARGTFTITAPTMATVTNNGANLVAIDGTIEDVNDALLDVVFDLDATVDGSTPTQRFDTAHFVVHDYGREGFCDCTSDPGLVSAPLSSCNRYDYANHSVLVLDCQGEKVTRTLGPSLWLYGARPLDRFSDFDGDGERDTSLSGRTVVDLSVPPIDNRTGWNYNSWSLGIGGFGFLDDFSPCPLLTGAGLRTDLTGQDIRQYMARSWFYVSPGTVDVTVRLTSDWPLHLYVNGDLIGSHPGSPGHLEGPVCPTSTVVEVPFWYAPDYPHRDEDDTYLNEISLLAHPNATYFNGEVLAESCQNPDSCRSKTCNVQSDCGPSCSCGEPRYDASTGATLYREALPNQPIKSGVCIPNRCGNGIVDSVVEECDDGNLIDDDGCSNHCRRNVAQGRCYIDRLTREEAQAQYRTVQGQLKDDPDNEALQAEAARLENMLELLGMGQAFDGRQFGFDRYGRFCAGSCPLSNRVCEGVFSSDGTVLEDCLCGDGEPDVCAMRLVEGGPTDASGAAPHPLDEGVDVYGRYCSGFCPVTGELCAGSWTLQDGKDVLLSCGCRGEGCFLDRRANEGRGACQGGCPQEVTDPAGSAATSAAQLLSLASLGQKQCIPTYYGDRVASCDCPADDAPAECKLGVDPRTGGPTCSGRCPKTDKECVLERDEAFGGARCGCPSTEPTEGCKPNYYARVPACSGKCPEGDEHVCLSVYYAPSGKPDQARLAGCKCPKRAEEGCTLKTEPGAPPQCSGECKATGTECKLSRAGNEVLCGCSTPTQPPPLDPDVAGPCRVNRELNICEGVADCGRETKDFVYCEPIFMSGDRVEKCGCPATQPDKPPKGCKIEDNMCFGACESLGVPCRGSYINGKLQSCGCPDEESCAGCRPYSNDACVVTANCRDQSSVSMELTLESSPPNAKTGTGTAYGQISGQLAPRFAQQGSRTRYDRAFNLMLAPATGIDNDCDGLADSCSRTGEDNDCDDTDSCAHPGEVLAKKHDLLFSRFLSFRFLAVSYSGEESLGTLELEEPMDFSMTLSPDAINNAFGEGKDVSSAVEGITMVFIPEPMDGKRRAARPLSQGPRCKGRYEPRAEYQGDLTVQGQLCGTGTYAVLLRTKASSEIEFTTTVTESSSSTTFTPPRTTTTEKTTTTTTTTSKASDTSSTSSTPLVKRTTTVREGRAGLERGSEGAREGEREGGSERGRGTRGNSGKEEWETGKWEWTTGGEKERRASKKQGSHKCQSIQCSSNFLGLALFFLLADNDDNDDHDHNNDHHNHDNHYDHDDAAPALQGGVCHSHGL